MAISSYLPGYFGGAKVPGDRPSSVPGLGGVSGAAIPQQASPLAMGVAQGLSALGGLLPRKYRFALQPLLGIPANMLAYGNALNTSREAATRQLGGIQQSAYWLNNLQRNPIKRPPLLQEVQQNALIYPTTRAAMLTRATRGQMAEQATKLRGQLGSEIGYGPLTRELTEMNRRSASDYQDRLMNMYQEAEREANRINLSIAGMDQERYFQDRASMERGVAQFLSAILAPPPGVDPTGWNDRITTSISDAEQNRYLREALISQERQSKNAMTGGIIGGATSALGSLGGGALAGGLSEGGVWNK